MPDRSLRFTLLNDEWAICRLGPAEPIPSWATSGPVFFVARTSDELSVITVAAAVPAELQASRGWRCLKLEGPFDFSQIGVIASFAGPLAEAGIPISVVSTYDTDYLLVQQGRIESTIGVLTGQGYIVRGGDASG